MPHGRDPAKGWTAEATLYDSKAPVLGVETKDLDLNRRGTRASFWTEEPVGILDVAGAVNEESSALYVPLGVRQGQSREGAPGEIEGRTGRVYECFELPGLDRPV